MVMVLNEGHFVIENGASKLRVPQRLNELFPTTSVWRRGSSDKRNPLHKEKLPSWMMISFRFKYDSILSTSFRCKSLYSMSFTTNDSIVIGYCPVRSFWTLTLPSKALVMVWASNHHSFTIIRNSWIPVIAHTSSDHQSDKKHSHKCLWVRNRSHDNSSASYGQ